jgi:formate-dependent phosphoribosylglycinamide formyltransferase (GAR transformylase)
MGVCLAKGASIEEARAKASAMAEKIQYHLE